MLRFFLISTTFFLSLVFSSKVVSTKYGKVRGATVLSDDYNHKYTFKSIPFAKPPVGDLRFALPQNPDPWNHILNASEYSPSCMSNFTQTRFPPKSLSEDCLYINIFTSEKCLTKKCAVIIYYHGGAFRVDSAVMFPDDFILERYVSEDIVFVIPAYRLGSFGQLYFGQNDYLSENLLLFDTVKALHFVHNEIENFGGDPKRVTIMGHSAGATLVEALGFSKLVDPDSTLFQQMITFSAHGEYGFYDVAIDNSYDLAMKLGCITKEQNDQRNSADVPEILKCLRSLDSFDILKMQSEIIRADETNFKSIIRGAPIMELNGKISDLKKNPPPRNIICGTTELEFQDDPYKVGAAGTFLDFENPHEVVKFYYDQMPVKKWMDPLSSAVYITARTYCEAMTAVGADAYIYETRQKPYSIHVTDMQYFIGVHREKIHTPDMDILDSFYSKMLANFTKTGVPSPEWGKLDSKRMNYLELKVDSELHEGPRMMERFHDDVIEIWEGPVTEYDRNLTKLKQFESLKSLDSGSVFKKWWFYLIVITIISFVIAFCLMFIRKSKQEERTPLLL